MAQRDLPVEEIVRRCEEIYQRDLRARLDTPENMGKHLVIEVETGDYEMDADEIAATDRLLVRHPAAVFYFLRIGYDSSVDIFGCLAQAATSR